MNQAFARAVSIFGHPMLVLPLAALAVAISRGQGRAAAWMALGFAVFAAAVMTYSWWQVHRGRWAHVDASGAGERRSLNRFLLVALVVSAILAMRYGHDRELALGLGLSAAMISVAMLTARWWKLSLHMAFVVFAATLLWSVAWWAGLAGFSCAAAIAWSRLQLQRHVPRDLLAGAATGLLAGIVFLRVSGVA
ncbi:MAG: hypothetical protein ABI538_06420 [Pseudoxanthomonas sp.]